MTEQPVVIYIGGTGRSGSTLLDRILSASQGCAGCGELSYLFEVYRNYMQHPCGCQNNVEDCEVWRAVFKILDAEVEFSKTYEHYEQVFQSVEQRWPKKVSKNSEYYREYKMFTEILLKAIHRSIPEAKFIVDSSTSGRFCLFRPLALARVAKQRVYLLHLTRDPRGIVYGFLNKPADIDANKWMNVGPCGVYTYAKWLLINILTLFQSLFIPNVRYCYVTYEELIANPDATMQRIEKIFGLERILHTEQAGIVSFPTAGHQITGNLAVMSQNPLSLRADKKWEEKLPQRYKYAGLLFSCVWRILFAGLARLRSRVSLR